MLDDYNEESDYSNWQYMFDMVVAASCILAGFVAGAFVLYAYL